MFWPQPTFGNGRRMPLWMATSGGLVTALTFLRPMGLQIWPDPAEGVPKMGGFVVGRA